tara:strand:- start:6003 stop:6158 length:156 start_codon:yes stop_codon:yes gene_type:complete
MDGLCWISVTLGRFLVIFAIGLIAAIALKATWLYWLLGVAAAWVVFKLIKP